MPRIRVRTIGFTQTTAERFFERLEKSRTKQLIDVRLHNTSQLAGFAKADDLAFFLDRIAGIAYHHEPLLAPTDAMLKSYKKDGGDWPTYQTRFMTLMAERRVEQRLDPTRLQDACLLCSEATPHQCHRRLVCEYLNEKWDGALVVEHL